MTRDARRDARYDVELCALLRLGPRSIAISTQNVSEHGFLLRTAIVPALGERLRLTVLPADGAPIALDVSPIHIERGDWFHGFGVRLLGSDPRWARIVAQIEREQARSSEIRLRADHMNTLLKLATASHR